MPLAESLDLSPRPILDAFEQYRGSFTDLDREFVASGPMLRTARDRLVAQIRDHGLRPGDRTILCLGNGPAFVSAFVAVLAAGGSPLLVHAETPPAELQRLALTFGARCILSDGWSVDELNPISLEAHTVTIDGWPSLVSTAIHQGHPHFNDHYPRLESVPLHPTSGTTGQPRVAVRPGAAALAEARNFQRTLAVTESDRLLCAVPMSHLYGFGTSVMLPLVTGASVVSTRRFNPRTLHRGLRDHAPTILPVAPAMLDLWLLAGGDEPVPIPRRVLTAGAPLPERTARAFFEKTGQAATPLYGTTETGGISVADESAGCVGPCVGPAMQSIRVDIRPVPDSPDLPPGVGRVRIQSPSMMAGYLSEHGIDRSPLVDGWFDTGDLGFLDERRAIHLVGREKDIVNVFGMKVVPSEVEAVIAAFPEVVDVKVYARRHRSGSEIVAAAVAAPQTLNLAGLREHCARQLAPFKRPEMITRLDALPRSATGKILRDRLP